MLEKNFLKIFTKFRLESYKKIFARTEMDKNALSALEIFCIEIIYGLERPTIQEFAKFIGISSPNAAYKINNLIKKGYINKNQSKVDKREYNLEVSSKFKEHYGLTYEHTQVVSEKIRQRFGGEEVEQINEYITIIVDELMNE